MRLLGLEIKRVLKTKLTWILMCVAIVLSILLAYLPATFESGREVGRDGNSVGTELHGMRAVRYYRTHSSVKGEVTPEILEETVCTYQKVYSEYDSVYGEEVPSEVYYEKLRGCIF